MGMPGWFWPHYSRHTTQALNLQCHLFLLRRRFLARDFRPTFARFGQSDRNCLFLTGYFLARAPALKRSSLTLVHCALYSLGGFFAVLSHFSPFCRRYLFAGEIPLAYSKADTKSCMRLANFAILKLLRPVLVF
jgi:hypothetical protein